MSGDRAQQRRQLAGECLAMAKQATDAGIRDSMVAMANKCLDLVERDELEILRKSLRLRAIQNNIGQELQSHYELPQKIPNRVLTLLMQLNDGNA